MRFSGMITALTAMVSIAGAGADFAVKVTGHGGDILTGYYVEYTINGRTYRSNTAGERINCIAWDHMNA